MAKFCPYCGNQLGERSKFCPVCGKASPERRRTGVLTGDSIGPGQGVTARLQPPAESASSPLNPAIAAGRTSVSGNHHPESQQGSAALGDAAGAASVGRQTETRRARPVTVKMAGARARLYAPPTHVYLGAFEQAGFGLRYGAWMFDFLIILIGMMSFTFLVTAVSHKSVVGSNGDLVFVAGLTFLLFLMNFVLLAGLNGQSAGMRILGIRIVRVDGKQFSIRHALVRHIIGYPLSMAVFFLGFLWMLWDPRQQAWHDKLARTIVIMSR
ncbi:MAG TPA: RDD family protein [Blastocatellia bacterium]